TQVYNSDGAITDDGQTIDFSSPITLYAYWIDTWASSEYISQPSGAGDEQSPYLISTAEELAWIANQVNFHGQTFEGYVFKQTEDDIDLGDHIWLPIGTESTPFKGTFYGRYTDDYWIENMTISNEVDYASSGEQYIMDIAGLFGEVENATIENVWLITGEVYANNYAGGIVGAWEGNVSASNCSVADFSIICDSLKSDKSLCAGSIIAYIGGDTADSVTVSIDSCVIETSAIDVNSYASAYSGGVVGCIDHKNIQNSDITIKNCYVDWGCKIYAATCDGTTNNSACAGGIVGMIYNPNKTLNETISGCEIYANLIQGQSFNIAGSVAGGVIAVARLEAAECSLEMKDNYVSTSISGGATDNDNSVAIAYIGGMCGTIETSTLTIANIDFNNCVVEDSKISGYARYVGGAGLIGNLYLKNQGLLNVKNCDVLNSNIYFTTSGDLGYVSGLVGGVFYSDTIIENCNVLGGSISSSTTNDAYAGGLVGVDYSTTTTIDMCHVSAPILGTSSTAYAYVAGIIGYSNVNSLNITRSEITSNEITGNASTNCSTGGIVGYARDITAKTCFVKCPAISASSSTASVAVGGLAAQAKTINISACSVEAGVAGSTISDKTSYSGGLIGLGVSMNITGCLFDGTVAGSLAGLISGRVTENTSVVSNILCRTSSTLTTLVAYSSDSPSPTNVIVETDSGNYYIDGGDGFAKWGIVEDKPLPAELFWIASGASVCTIDWLTEKGYTVL
ncbi:MAG: hypothetical protein IJX25_05000, partial [Clostridia bacterium]|nr:hypothetical protein [Clostridia bacterium]